MDFKAKEDTFMADLCQGDRKKIQVIESYRAMKFDQMPIKVRSYQCQFFTYMREEFQGEVNFDFVESFNIEDNYDQIIRACKNLINKPTRPNMKLETFDKKF